MTITQLKVLLKVFETGSFTKAGELLNMTQPAVSHAISGIENELDVQLFIRDRRKGLKVTDVGERLIVHVREILNSIEKMEQEVALEKGFEVGTIRIGSFPSASALLLPKVIRIFRENYPGLEFNFYEGSIQEIKESLLTRLVDVGIIILPYDEMETIPLMKEEMVVVLPDGHPLLNNESISVKDLHNEPLIIFKGGYEKPIVELFDQSKATLRIEYVVHSVQAALNMIREGLGVAILSELSYFSLPSGVNIRKLEPNYWREIGLAVPSIEDSSLAVQLFIKTMQKLYQSEE